MISRNVEIKGRLKKEGFKLTEFREGRYGQRVWRYVIYRDNHFIEIFRKKAKAIARLRRI